MTTHAEPARQTALDEEVVDDPRLLEALNARQAAKVTAGEARKAYAEANGAVQALVGEHTLDEGDAIRCGPYRITRRAVPPRAVSFETSPSSRITIALVDADQ